MKSIATRQLLEKITQVFPDISFDELAHGLDKPGGLAGYIAGQYELTVAEAAEMLELLGLEQLEMHPQAA